MTDKIELHGLLSLSHVSCVLYHVALDSCSHCVATLVLPLPVTLLYIRLSVLSVCRFANINSHNILLSISHWRRGWLLQSIVLWTALTQIQRVLKATWSESQFISELTE